MPALTLSASAVKVVAAVAVAGAVTTGAVMITKPKAPHQRAGFTISGNVKQNLYPGAAYPLDLRITNHRRRRLLITRLYVRARVDRTHRRRGCTIRRDFFIRQLPRQAYPIRIPRRSSRTLSSLGLRYRVIVGMYNDPNRNQDACKGAQLIFRYSGRGTRKAKIAYVVRPAHPVKGQ